MLKRIGAEESGEFKAVASGTLPCGRPVVVNADGTVSSVAGSAESIGTPVVFETGVNWYNAATFDSNSNKVVIAYSDSGNSHYGTAVVGTVSGSSISFGTPVVFSSSNTRKLERIAFDSSNNKIVIAYSNVGSSGDGTAIVGTVSGTSISFGTAVVFHSGDVDWVSVTFDSSNNKVVVAYTDVSAGNDHGHAIVGTVSGTSISFGSEATFNSATTFYVMTTFDSNSNKVVIAYRDNGNSGSGTAKVGTVSGTSISFGSASVFESGGISFLSSTFDSNANKVVLAYQDGSNSSYGTAVVGTVSGTSISFGTPQVFNSASTFYTSATFDTDQNRVLISISNANATGDVVPTTVSGTSLTFDDFITFESGQTEHLSSTFDTNQNSFVAAYTDGGNGNKGTSNAVRLSSTNITSENYIGMSRGVAFQTGSAAAVGSKTEFESGDVKGVMGTVYDPDNQKIIISYVDDDNSDYGTAVVGTISGTTVSFGTPAVFESGTTGYTSIGYDTANDKVVIAYRDESNSNYGTAVVGTVSGTSISFGTPVAFNSRDTRWIQVTFDTNAGKTVISYSDNGGTSDGKANVGTVSGTSISFGSQATFASTNANYTAAVYDSNAQKHVMCYRDNSNSDHGKAVVGTVSGTDITFGSAATFNSSSTEDIGIGFDSSNNKVVVANTHGSDSNKIKAYVGTVSGTSISFGSATEIVSQSYGANVLYSPTASKILIGYATSSNIPSYKTCTVSGTSITNVSDSVTLGEALSVRRFAFDLSSGSFLVVGRLNTGGGSASYAFTLNTIATTRGEVASGQAASMDIIGSVSDNQIGLTTGQQYFVQTDGTIGTTAATPSVLAGTAISATELVVKT